MKSNHEKLYIFKKLTTNITTSRETNIFIHKLLETFLFYILDTYFS